MDFLFAELMLVGPATRATRWFNLGMAPLSGLDEHAARAAVEPRRERFSSATASTSTISRVCARTRRSSIPVWEPRYLASPGGLALGRVLASAAGLISGGLRGVVTK